ncbi:MAG: S8 family serine peptidase [Oscillospiraceae bacterium]|nr:S8 family serine peptidase [Oscillospiraceae bacterium]
MPHGNEGFGGHHFLGEINEGETLEINFTISPGLTSIFLTLWKDFVDDFEIELVAPNGETTGKLPPNIKNRTIVIGETLVNFFNTEPVPYNEEQELFFLLTRVETGFESPLPNMIFPGGWKIRVRGINIVDGIFNIWLPTIEEVTRDTSFRIPNINTTLTLPSTSKKVITVGAYNSSINAVADFSGRGYTRSNVYIKPDLAAPGVNIITTTVGGGYDSYTGTSFATPFVTGAVSLLMEFGIVNNNDPFLYGQRIKSFLRKGARREPNIMYPNPRWGYGFLCIMNVITRLIRG